MNIDFSFSYLNQSMIWTHSLSALWSGDSGTLWWRRKPGCVLTWPRFRTLITAEEELALPANVTSPTDEAPGPLPAGALVLWTSVLLLTLVGGRLYCIWEMTCWPWAETLSSEASRFGWSTTLFESSGYTTGVVVLCEWFQEGNTRLSSWLPVQNYSVYCYYPVQ